MIYKRAQDTPPECISKKHRGWHMKPSAPVHQTKFSMLGKNILEDKEGDFDYQNCKRVETKPSQQTKKERKVHAKRTKTFIVSEFEQLDQQKVQTKQQPDIYFKQDSDYEQRDASTWTTLVQSETPAQIVPARKEYSSFFQIAADCKLLSQSRDLLNKLPIFDRTEFRISRKRNNLTTHYILYTVNFQQEYEKRFLMSITKTVNLSETIFEASICYSFPENIINTEYEVGTIVSDFARNVYQITSRGHDRKMRVRFSDIILMDRQVKLQLFTQPNEPSKQYRNIPQKYMGAFDYSMMDSKRNIIVAPIKPIENLKSEDFILKIKKVSINGFSLVIRKDLTPLQAFCFSVVHLDRQA